MPKMNLSHFEAALLFSLFTSVFLTRWLLQLAVEYGWIKDHVRMLRVIGVPKIR